MAALSRRKLAHRAATRIAAGDAKRDVLNRPLKTKRQFLPDIRPLLQK